MLKGFEDAFMDAQASVVSLCLELLDSSNVSADKVYIYMFQNEVQDYVNAFFEKNGKIMFLNELFEDEQIYDFFRCAVQDVENIINVCDTYDSKCPNEFRLIYDIRTKAFDSAYKYEDYVSENCGVVETFNNWIDECKEKLDK